MEIDACLVTASGQANSNPDSCLCGYCFTGEAFAVFASPGRVFTFHQRLRKCWPSVWATPSATFNFDLSQKVQNHTGRFAFLRDGNEGLASGSSILRLDGCKDHQLHDTRRNIEPKMSQKCLKMVTHSRKKYNKCMVDPSIFQIHGVFSGLYASVCDRCTGHWQVFKLQKSLKN